MFVGLAGSLRKKLSISTSMENFEGIMSEVATQIGLDRTVEQSLFSTYCKIITDHVRPNVSRTKNK